MNATPSITLLPPAGYSPNSLLSAVKLPLLLLLAFLPLLLLAFFFHPTFICEREHTPLVFLNLLLLLVIKTPSLIHSPGKCHDFVLYGKTPFNSNSSKAWFAFHQSRRRLEVQRELGFVMALKQMSSSLLTVWDSHRARNNLCLTPNHFDINHKCLES